MDSELGSVLTNSPDKDEDPMDHEVGTADEEDEGEEDNDVFLGVTKIQHPRLLHRHYFPSKIGGVPAWLDPKDLPEGKSRNCGFCGLPLQFLLQMYAPIDQEISKEESTFHRTLFVFMCLSMSCLRRDQHEQWKRGYQRECRSVKVFRCQLPLVNPFYSSKPLQKPLTNLVPLCSWCCTWKGDKVCGSCKTARYCSEIHQSLHWKSGHKNDCHQIVSLLASEASQDNGRAKLSSTEKIACNTLWPEYEIVSVTDEAQDDTVTSSDVSSGMSGVLKDDKLVETLSKDDNVDETDEFWMEKAEAGDDKKNWASFEERISKAPKQVVRYYGYPKAKPLWPLLVGRPSEADLPKCNYCHGSLCCEFQIMPQLLYYLKVLNDPDSLDWATMVVYTCEASCEASVAYKEEFAWVQLYPDEHT